MVILFDTSGSVGSTNFQKMRDFATSLISNFKFAGDTADPNNMGATVGIVRFGTGNDTILAPSTSKSTATKAIKDMAYIGGSTYILDGMKTSEEVLRLRGRRNVVNKVILTLYDGEPNGPCSCGACRTRYSYVAGGNIPREQECKSARYPYRTCNTCDLNQNYVFKCMPCSDVVPLTTEINNRKPDVYGNTPNGYWRVIPVGIGQALSNAEAQQMLRDMSYDPNRSFYVDWDQLTQLYQTVSDQTCNLVDIGDSETSLKVIEPVEPEAIKCGDIVSIRGVKGFLNYDDRYNNLDNCLVGDGSNPNTAGKNRRGLWQVVCPGKSSGTRVEYNQKIALFNLQSKTYMRRTASNDKNVQVTGTQAELNSNTAALLWDVETIGYSTTGPVYYSNSACLGSTTRDSANALNNNQSGGLVTAASTCVTTGANSNLYLVTIPWNSIANKNFSPSIGESDLPVPVATY